MSLRLIVHIPRRTIKLLLYTLASIALLFIALTQTQIGREGLRLQMERQFNENFLGELRIGRLQGNFVNTLYASDIDLLDSTGTHVASIDVVILQPRWFELLTRTFSLSRITLIRPEFNILLREDSTWNIADVFKPRTESRRALPWQFASSDIRITEGKLRTHNVGAPPEIVQEGRLFDYASATAADIQAQLNIEWDEDLKLLDLDHLSFILNDESISLKKLHGEFAWENDRVELNDIYLESGATRIHAAGWINGLDLLTSNPGALDLDLRVSDSHIDNAMFQYVFPDYPLADTLQVTTSIKGSLNALQLEWLQITRGDLLLASSGEIYGLPDSARFNLSFANSLLSRSDLQTILPAADLSRLPADMNPFFPTFDARGSFKLDAPPLERPFYSEVDFSMESPAGSLTGSGEISRAESDSIAHYRGHVRADSLNLARLLPSTSVSSLLNGTVAIRGSGMRLEDLVDTEMQIGLGPSRLDGHPIDTLDVYLYASEGVLNGGGFMRQARYGSLESDVQLRFGRAVPTLEAGVKWSDLNLGRLLKKDSLSTDLDGQLLISGRGASLDALRGEVSIRIDSSMVQRGKHRQVVLPHKTTLTFTDLSPRVQALTLDGDAGHLNVVGNLHPEAILALGQLWSQTLANTFREITDNPRPGRSFDPTPTAEVEIEQTVEALYLDELRERAAIALDSLSRGMPLALEIELAIVRTDILETWLPDAPPLYTHTQADLRVEATSDYLSIGGRVDADSLRLPRIGFDRIKGDFSMDVDGLLPAEERISLQGTFLADSLRLLGQALPSPLLTLNLKDRQGALDIVTRGSQRTGPQQIATRFELLPDRNRWHIEDLFLSIGNSSWTMEDRTYLDLFDRAIVIPGLSLQSRSVEAGLMQRVRLSGVLSPEPSDTAAIRIDNIALRPLSEFAQMKTLLGGLINGELALTTTSDQPELTGIIEVDRFSLDNRVLGNVFVSSRYITGQPDVGLRVALAPVDSLNRDLLLPDAALEAVYENNALLLDGTFRLPRFNEGATGFIDAGALDLRLELERADVFFFEYIFPNMLERADGYLTGAGTISGDFSFPLFDANLELVDSEISIPRFNLLYTGISGPVRVNREGIMLDRAILSDPTGGRATISGGFLFNDYRYFSFDLSANLDELLIMNQEYSEELPFYGQIWSSGTLTLTGPSYNAMLLSTDAVTKASSELFIPVTEDELNPDVGFLIFTDSTGQVPDLSQLAYRRNLLSQRPEGERRFEDGLSMDLNIFAPSGSTIHLVFDPLLGDVVNAVSSGRIQIQRREGEIRAFGTLNVESGDYLFTAGDVFARRFLIDRGGSITWDGDPIDARLTIPASFRTRASTAGLPGAAFNENTQIPLIVRLDISGRVSSPEVALSLETDRSDRNYRGNYEGLETILNQAEHTTDFATSVLLTNSFLLTTETTAGNNALSTSGNQLAFSSVSQLVASQLNRFLNKAIPNVDLNLGLQGESLEDPNVTYGVALYLLDERLVIRGQGIYQNSLTQDQAGLEGEFEVEIRLNSNVSVSVFLRREGDVLAENALTSTRGAGLSYQTQFPSWRRLLNRLFGWLSTNKSPSSPTDQVAARPDE